ncbi:MAG TPA: Hsp20/alpha crystallin family protein [Chryseosolibacter sp.]|nr:Hsp20/alpha crystallin family protein [Chryseosolibacter sp.]
MSLIRYKTSNDFVPVGFGTLIDRFFNENLSRSGGAAYSFVPKVDIFENEKAFEIHVAVPGMKKDDFTIDLNEDRLTVSGERKFTKEQKEENFQRIETQYGAFSRSFVLPETINTEAISAKYENGILEVVLPKDEKKTVKTTIKVN